MAEIHNAEYEARKDRPHECCRWENNLVLTETSPTTFIETCVICQCRHHIAFVGKIELGLVGKDT